MLNVEASLAMLIKAVYSGQVSGTGKCAGKERRVEEIGWLVLRKWPGADSAECGERGDDPGSDWP